MSWQYVFFFQGVQFEFKLFEKFCAPLLHALCDLITPLLHLTYDV